MAVGLYSGVSGLALGIGLYKGVSGLWGGASGLINGFGGSGPFPGASLYLDFLTPPLDSRITFSRGSNATLVDATGKITYAPANLLAYSEQFDNAIWSKQAGVSVTGVNVGVAPDGTTTADEVTFTATTNDSIYQGLILPANTTYAFSVWVKGLGGQVVQVSAQPNAASPVFTPVTLNGQWQRVTAIATTGATAGTLNAAIDLVSGTTPAVVQLWGAQLEPVTYQTTPSTYVATTASAYYAPRFDYDPVTLAPKGLLIEEQRTNLALYSQQFDDASWIKSSATVTANTTVSPDGTTNADTATTTAANGAVQTTQAIAANTATYTATVYVKYLSGSTTVRLRLALTGGTAVAKFVSINASTGAFVAGDANYTITNAGNGWFRVSADATNNSTNTSAAFQIFTTNDTVSTNAIFIYGAQLEAGSFATSYIPTVASTVTRSADVATMTGTNFSSWYNQSEGTIVWSGDFAVNSSNRLVSIDAGIAARTADIYGTGSNALSYYKTSDAQQIQFGSGVALNTVFTAAVAIKLNDYIGAVNGVTGGSDTATGAVAVADRLSIGHWNNGGQLNGHIRQIAYYNTRLPNASLQTLTAPSLATTLSLSFTNQAYTVGV